MAPPRRTEPIVEEREDQRTNLGRMLMLNMLQDDVREMQLDFPFGPMVVTLTVSWSVHRGRIPGRTNPREIPCRLRRRFDLIKSSATVRVPLGRTMKRGSDDIPAGTIDAAV